MSILVKQCLRLLCTVCRQPLGVGSFGGDGELHFDDLAEACKTAESADWIADWKTGNAVCSRDDTTCMPACVCDDIDHSACHHFGHCTLCPRAHAALPERDPATPSNVEHVTCVELRCSNCGLPYVDDDTEGTIHFPDAAAAYAAAEGEWIAVGDQMFCDRDDCSAARQKAHDAYYGTDVVMPGQLALAGFDNLIVLAPKQGGNSWSR